MVRYQIIKHSYLHSILIDFSCWRRGTMVREDWIKSDCWIGLLLICVDDSWSITKVHVANAQVTLAAKGLITCWLRPVHIKDKIVEVESVATVRYVFSLVSKGSHKLSPLQPREQESTCFVLFATVDFHRLAWLRTFARVEQSLNRTKAYPAGNSTAEK